MAAETPSSVATEAVPPSSPVRSSRLSDWRVQWALVMAVALVLRLIYLFETQRWPFFYTPVLDSSSQWEWAQQVLQTSLWMGTARVLAKPPLYTYFLTIVVWLLGAGKAGLFGAHLLQLLLGVVTSGLIYLIGRRTFGAGAGLVAGLMYAVYSQGIFNEGELLDSALTTCLAALLLFVLLVTIEKPTTARWFGVGVLAGLLGLTRGNLLLLGVIVLVLLWRWMRRVVEGEEVRAMALAFIAGVALTILPVTARNAVLTHQFVPIATNGSINLYTGNNPDADGFSPIPAGYAWERSWYQWMPQGQLSFPQQDAFWRKRAQQFWLQHPGQALALTIKKIYLYWNSYDVPNNVGYGWGRTHSALLRVTLPFAVLGPLGLLGMLMGWRRNRAARAAALLVLTTMVTTVIFFIAGRYRMAMMPALLPFAGLAVMEIAGGVRAHQWRQLAPVLVGLVLCVAFIDSDVYGVRRARGADRDAFLVGNSYLLQYDSGHAIEALRQAVKEHPDDADAWVLLGQAQEFGGSAKDAADSYRQALRVAPDFAKAAAMLAELSIAQRWPLEEPRRLLVRALKEQYRSAQGLISLTHLDLARGDKAQAAADLEKLAPVAASQASWGRGYAQFQQSLMQVVQQAQAAGVPLPSELDPNAQRPSAGPQGME